MLIPIAYQYRRWTPKKPSKTVSINGKTYSFYFFLSFVTIYWILPLPVCFGYMMTDGQKAIKLTPSEYRNISSGQLNPASVETFFANAPVINTERFYPYIIVPQTIWLFLTPFWIIINLIVGIVTYGAAKKVSESIFTPSHEIVEENLTNVTTKTNGVIANHTYYTFDNGEYLLILMDSKSDNENAWTYMYVLGSKQDFEKVGIDLSKFEADSQACAEEYEKNGDNSDFTKCFYAQERDLYGTVKATSTLDTYEFDLSDRELRSNWMNSDDVFNSQVLIVKDPSVGTSTIIIGLLMVNVIFLSIAGVLGLWGLLDSNNRKKYWTQPVSQPAPKTATPIQQPAK